MNNQESKIERKMNIQGALYVIHIGGEMNDKSDASYDALFRSYEGANKRIKELEETCACLRLTISKLESLLTQAGLNFAELRAEITRLREGGCARDAAILDWIADSGFIETVMGGEINVHEEAMRIADAEPTVEDYRLALRQMVRAAMDEESAHSGEAQEMAAKLASLTICTGALSANAHLWREIDSQSNTASRTDVRCERCGVYGEMEYATGDITFPTT